MKNLKKLTNKQLYKFYEKNCLCEVNDNGNYTKEGKKQLKVFNTIEEEIRRRFYNEADKFLKAVKDLPTDPLDMYKEVDFYSTMRCLQ